MALRAGAEGWSLHADDGASLMEDHAVTLHGSGAFLDDAGEPGVERVGEPDVADYAALEEGEGTDAFGAVDDLVGNDEIHGLDLFAEGTHGGEGDDGAYADEAEGGDVGSGRDFMGRELMIDAVAGEEGDGDTIVLGYHDGRGWVAPWRERVEGCYRGVALDFG